MHYGKSIIGSEGGSSLPHIDIPRYLRMLSAGRFDAADMVSHRYPLHDVNAAIDAMRAGESVHIMLDC
jgi:Zn-dependent alcohol dehydrogenase